MFDPAVSKHCLPREGLGLWAGGHPAHLQVRRHRFQRTTGEENVNVFKLQPQPLMCTDVTLQLALCFAESCFCMQLGPDKKFSLIFAIFDENRSWYFDENMRKSTQKSFNTTEPDFYNSNVIYSELRLLLFGGCY